MGSRLVSIAVGCTLVAAFLIPSATAGGDVSLRATKNRFLDTEPVEVALTNNATRRVELFGGAIVDRASDNVRLRLQPATRYLAPGESQTWMWDPAGDVGRYRARFRTGNGTKTDDFEIGAYFTIGFRCDQDCPPTDPYIIFVRKEGSIDELRADLKQPEAERRIVSGIVSRARPYNSSWSYTMGPGSIILGEVFIEVCDASPHYVEENLDDWMGERWCPWSSFVASEGR